MKEIMKCVYKHFIKITILVSEKHGKKYQVKKRQLFFNVQHLMRIYVALEKKLTLT